MLVIILIFWTLLKFCQCPFSHPGCNKGSHIAFSCHVLLVSFILKHFLSFSSSSHDLVSTREFFCRILLHLNLMFPHDETEVMHTGVLLNASYQEAECLITRDINLGHTGKLISIRHLWGDSLRLCKYAVCLHTYAHLCSIQRCNITAVCQC